MGTGAFDALFSKLGLDSLPADLSIERTLLADHRALAPAAASEAPPVAATLRTLVFEAPHREGEAPETAELVAVELLGEGGMGQVLLAHQRSLGRDVAVKMLKPNAASDAAAAALTLEARTTGSLEHPGVVPVYALARDSAGLPALVMKRVEGSSWRELLRDANHPAWQHVARNDDRLCANLEILVSVCNAIAHAHQRGVFIGTSSQPMS